MCPRTGHSAMAYKYAHLPACAHSHKVRQWQRPAGPLNCLGRIATENLHLPRSSPQSKIKVSLDVFFWPSSFHSDVCAITVGVRHDSLQPFFQPQRNALKLLLMGQLKSTATECFRIRQCWMGFTSKRENVSLPLSLSPFFFLSLCITGGPCFQILGK